MGAKIDKKSIKKGVQHGKASWHRFLIDFGGFGEPSWDRRSTKNRFKKASKKRCKNEVQQDGENVAIKSYDAAVRWGSGPGGGAVCLGSKGFVLVAKRNPSPTG